MNPETAFNALGGVMQLFQETIEDYRRQLAALQQVVTQQQALLDSKSNALQVQGPAKIHVRRGGSGGRAAGDSGGVGTQDQEHQKAPRVQAREVEHPKTQEVGKEQGRGQREQRLVGFERLTDPYADEPPDDGSESPIQ